MSMGMGGKLASADGDPNIYPLRDELCNGKDDDCDGRIDEGNPLLTSDATLLRLRPAASLAAKVLARVESV